MAKAKTPTKTPSPKKSASASIFTVEAESGALEAGTKAVGAASLQNGFGFTANDDLMFALGFPHMYLLVPDDGVDPVEEASRSIIELYPHPESFYRNGAAARLARVFALAYPFGEGTPPSLNDAAKHEILRDEPLTEEEGKALVFQALGGAEQVAFVNSRSAILMVEALIGTAAASEALIDALERINRSHFATRGYLYIRFIILLRFMALRLPSAASRGLLERAAALGKALVLNETQAKALGLSLLLGRSQEDVGDSFNQPIVVGGSKFVMADFNTRVAKKTLAALDSRDVFLGGDAVYQLILTHWALAKDTVVRGARFHNLIVERFGRIQSPTTVAMMLELSTKSKAKALARSWFDDFATYATPHLEALAKGGPRVQEAKKLLEKLG